VAKDVDRGVLVDVHGGHFRLTSIIQKRLRELVKGARPLVDVPRGRKDMIDVVFEELDEGRIEPAEGGHEPETEDIFQADPEAEPAVEDGTEDAGDEAGDKPKTE